MSLRKSPTLTPALLAANRNNARKSTGPRTARGKAWSRLNHMQHGGHSQDCLEMLKALYYAPPGGVSATARALLATKPVIHPVLEELVNLCIQTEIDVCRSTRSPYAPGS
jgi:hypothetical protein